MTRATRAEPRPHVEAAAGAPVPRRAVGWARPSRTVVCVALTTASAALAAAAPGHPASTPTVLVLSAVVVGWGGLPLHRAGWAALRRGAVDPEALAGAGVLAASAAALCGPGAPTAGRVALAAATVTVLLLGRSVEARAAHRAQAALRTPAVPDPGEVTVLHREPGGDDRATRIATAELLAGDRFEVRSGERVAADGVVVEGRSAVEPSGRVGAAPPAEDGPDRAVDGADAPPVEVGSGDRVAAGARNAGNRFVVRADGPAQVAAWRAAAAGFARDRRDAAVLRSAADRVTAGLLRLVAVVAVLTLGFWLGAGAGPGAAAGAAAAVLLATCTHTLGRAAEAGVLAALGRGFRLGLRARPRTLERMARVDTVLLCRTGTLTTGGRVLRAVHVAPGVDADEALRVAGAVAATGEEARGTSGGHAVGAVVAAAARARFGALPGVAEFDGYPCLGLRGVVAELRPTPDGDQRVIAHAALVGRVALLAEHGIVLPEELAAAVERVHAAGATAVAVAWDGVARAVLEVADPLRPGSADAVRGLRDLGLVPVVLTGDDAGAARGLTAAFEAGDVLAEVAPGDRAAAVARLRAEGRTVAVVGGPADGPALAAADVALVHDTPIPDTPIPDTGRQPPLPAGRAAHIDGSPDLADAVMLRDADPLTAVDALRLARRTVRTVERAATATIAYHLAVLPLAAAGLLPPFAAAVAAAACPAAVVLHAAALRRFRPLPRPVHS